MSVNFTASIRSELKSLEKQSPSLKKQKALQAIIKKIQEKKGGGRDLASRTVTPKTDHQESLTHLLEQASTALDQTTNDLITDLKKKLQTLTKQPSSPALHRALTTLLTDIEAALNASHLTDAQKNTLNSLKTRTSDKMNTLTPSSVRDPLETPTQQPPEKHAEAAAADTRSTKYYDLRLAADIELNTPVSREQIEALEKRLPLLYAQKKLPHFKTAVLGLLDKIEGTLLKSDGTTPRELLPPLKTDLAKLIIKTCMAPNTSDSPKISTFPHCKKILKEVFETACSEHDLITFQTLFEGTAPIPEDLFSLAVLTACKSGYLDAVGSLLKRNEISPKLREQAVAVAREGGHNDIVAFLDETV